MNRQSKKDLRKVVFHEYGHMIVATHFGAVAFVRIVKAGNATSALRAYTGQTSFSPLSPFQHSCMAWAGVMAENVLDGMPWDSLAVDTFEYAGVMDFDGFSDTDTAGIRKTNFIWRSCKTSAGILQRQWPTLCQLAELEIKHLK